jgi:hypothetical protein
MSRKVIDLHLNYNEILNRIEAVKDEIYPEKKTSNKKWANLVGISESLVSQLHPRKPRKEIKEPSKEYIIAVARVTGKPVEWYLYGETESQGIKDLTASYNTSEITPHAVHERPIDAGKAQRCLCSDMTEEERELCKKFKAILKSKNTGFAYSLKTMIAVFDQFGYIGNEKREPLRKLKQKMFTFSK